MRITAAILFSVLTVSAACGPLDTGDLRVSPKPHCTAGNEGCGGGNPQPANDDAGTTPEPDSNDAGTVPEPSDSGTTSNPEPSDSGTTPNPDPVDAGTTPDPEPVDAGTTPDPVDAGTTPDPEPVDAGTSPAPDPEPTDAGTTPDPEPVDAGTPADAGTSPNLDPHAPDPSSGIFVDANASCLDGSGGGTIFLPHCTLATAVTAYPAGTRFYVAEGDYAQPLALDRSVEIIGGYASLTWGAGGTTRVLSATDGIPAVDVVSGAHVTLESLTVAATASGNQTEAVYVSAGGSLTLRSAHVLGGTSPSNDADGILISGDVIIERSVIEGGESLGNDVEDNASAVHVNAGGTVQISNSMLKNARSKAGVSYGLVSFGTARVTQSRIEGGTSTGLFAIGIRNKIGAVLHASSNRITGGTSVNSFGLWSSGETFLVGNTVDGGDPLQTSVSCTTTTGCPGPDGTVFTSDDDGICQFAPGASAGLCAKGRTTAVMVDGGKLTLVNNILNGGGASYTGVACEEGVSSCPGALAAACIVDQCRGIQNAYHLASYGDNQPVELTTLNNIVTDGNISISSNGTFSQTLIWSSSSIQQTENEINSCTAIPSCVQSANNLALPSSTVLLEPDDLHTRAATSAENAGVDATTVLPQAVQQSVDVTKDVDGESRPSGVGWDIGADEH